MRQMCLRIEIAYFFVKCSLVNALFLWIPRVSGQNSGANWKTDDFIHIYKPGSDLEIEIPENYGPPVPTGVWIALVVAIFVFIVLCICGLLIFQRFRKSTSSRHSSRADLIGRPTSTTPQNQGIADLNPRNYMRQFSFTEFRGSGGDVPPEYAAVVDQKPNVSSAGRSNQYPKIVRGKKLETPPPAYMTVAPFK
ncbi:hypothetical protein NPIL_256681 [Nephila pilipes]|uniref:Uncharacterized protein n=1 Tax=Nephila pilipes TaxID=299642 RepID=A0A8X6UP45_NEPPI|nr:hypothetical protein NPIL_256681 [Nephila pilipes]